MPIHSSHLDNLLDSEMEFDFQLLPFSEDTSEETSLLGLDILNFSWDDLIDFIFDFD